MEMANWREQKHQRCKVKEDWVEGLGGHWVGIANGVGNFLGLALPKDKWIFAP
jgi:hypothetical protein